MRSTRSIGKRLKPSAFHARGLSLSRLIARLGFAQSGRRTAAIDSDPSLLYGVGILGSTTARYPYSSRRCSDVQKILVGKRGESAASVKRPARKVLDLLNVLRLDRDTGAELESCHMSQSVVQRLFFTSELNGLDVDLEFAHAAKSRANAADWTPYFRNPPGTRLVAEKNRRAGQGGATRDLPF
jgi:hypothetical protein